MAVRGKLTARQLTFIDEYLVDLNAAHAAVRAGYSPRVAKEIASRLMKNPKIAVLVGRAMAERSRRTGITAERVVTELAKIALLNPADLLDTEQGIIREGAAPEDTAAILSVKVKTIPTKDGDIVEREIKLADKNKALELLGRHLGMFDDRLKVTGAVVHFSGDGQLED